jgi:hypothetical protein
MAAGGRGGEAMDRRVKFECICGQHLVARESMAGTAVHCPMCLKEMAVPAPEDAQVLEESYYEEVERYAVVCTCGRQMLVKAEAAGHTIHCARCRKPIKLPPIEQLRGKKRPTLHMKGERDEDELTTTDLFLIVDDEEGPGTEIR